MIYTIGHSIHPINEFIKLLKLNKISAIADVRSTPFSRYQPQFNKESVSFSLKSEKIEYAFLGDSLGGRSNNQADYENGRVVYSRLRLNDYFENGVLRVIEGSKLYNLALMCSEKEPIECHRMLLVSQVLEERGIEVRHILENGSTESHKDSIKRLLNLHKLSDADLFRSEQEIIEEALLKQEKRFAFTLGDSNLGRLDINRLGESQGGDLKF